MKLEGSVINFLGDSITAGHGTSSPEKVYHHIIKEKYNMEFAYNYGVGGTKLAPFIKPTKENPILDLYFELRAEIMDRTADAVVVFGGTNDYGIGDAPFGNPATCEKGTFCGGVLSLIRKLKKDFPGKKLLFVTPIHRQFEENPAPLCPDAKTLADFSRAIKTICKNENIPILDLFEINPINPYDPSIVPDGLHPNDLGHEILAKYIGEKLLEL